MAFHFAPALLLVMLACMAFELWWQKDRRKWFCRNQAEALLVRELGEMEYMRQTKREAFDWIKTRPAEFLRLTASRVIHFWFGPLHQPLMATGISLLTILAFLGARQTLPMLTIPQRAALLIPLATFPLIYYIVPYKKSANKILPMP